MFGAVLSTTLASNLTRLVPASALAGVPIDQLARSPVLIAQLPPETHAGVVQAFSDSITLGFLVAVPIVVVAFILVLWMPELPLRDTTGRRAVSTEGEALPEMGV